LLINRNPKDGSVYHVPGAHTAVGGRAYLSRETRVLQLEYITGHGVSRCYTDVAENTGMWTLAASKQKHSAGLCLNARELADCPRAAALYCYGNKPVNINGNTEVNIHKAQRESTYYKIQAEQSQHIGSQKITSGCK